MQRRTFLSAAAGAAFAHLASAGLKDLAGAAPPVRLGLDLFSLRSQGWSPFQLLDFCAKWNLSVVHFSEIRFLGGLETAHLERVRRHASKYGIELEAGMASVCPSSSRFDAAQGPAEKQILRMACAAKTLGSPILRCYSGTMEDRRGPVPIEGHIDNTVRVLRNVKSRVVDLGLKIAVENHAGDMQARELKSLIEGAGKDWVGACLDSGNPLWALEDPHLTLETLAPYTLTSHVRDSAVWRVPDGASVQWVRMGEGTVGIADYVRRFIEKCPGRPLSLEVIVTQPRVFPYLKQTGGRDGAHASEFWDAYRNTPAWEFARFVRLSEQGTPRPQASSNTKESAAQREREDVEASLRWTKDLLSLPQ